MDESDTYHGPACGCDMCLDRVTRWVDNGDGTYSNRDAKKDDNGDR